MTSDDAFSGIEVTTRNEGQSCVTVVKWADYVPLYFHVPIWTYRFLWKARGSSIVIPFVGPMMWSVSDL